jgi:hypothetical protein
MLKVLEGGKNRNGQNEEGIGISLDELAREGARRMIAAALAVEVEDYVGRRAGERDEHGHALVVRNGTGRPRSITVGAGTIEVSAPRVNDKRVVDGERQKFTSKILPPHMRRSPKVDAVLPLLYLHGLSTGDFKQALPTLLGDDAAGLSPSATTWPPGTRAGFNSRRAGGTSPAHRHREPFRVWCEERQEGEVPARPRFLRDVVPNKADNEHRRPRGLDPAPNEGGRE